MVWYLVVHMKRLVVSVQMFRFSHAATFTLETRPLPDLAANGLPTRPAITDIVRSALPVRVVLARKGFTDLAFPVLVIGPPSVIAFLATGLDTVNARDARPTRIPFQRGEPTPAIDAFRWAGF